MHPYPQYRRLPLLRFCRILLRAAGQHPSWRSYLMPRRWRQILFELRADIYGDIDNLRFSGGNNKPPWSSPVFKRS